MSLDFLSLIEGIAHAAGIALDLDTLAKQPRIRELTTDLALLRQAVSVGMAREPLQLLPTEIAEMAKLASAIKAANEELQPHSSPSLRALAVFAKATDILVGHAYSGKLTTPEAQQLILAIDKLVPQVKHEHWLQ